MNQNQLPYRFREKTFRQYEQSLRIIISNYPRGSIFRPTNVETFSCRLRDAMTSLLTYGWDTDLLIANVRKIKEEMVVSIRRSANTNENTVWVGLPTDDFVDIVHMKETSTNDQNETIVNPSTEALNAIMVLHHERISTKASRISFTSPFTINKEFWESRYDVAIEGPDEKNIWTVL